MGRSRHFYIAVAVVFAASVVAYWMLPHGELIQQIAGIPLVGSLVVALLQILRDQAAHERQLLLLEQQNRFALGASSHMANVAFDKHVQFCEEYVAEVHEVLRTLFREGPSKDALRHTPKLFELQQKYAVWLTPQIENDLELFESALRKIGATAGLVETTGSVPDRHGRIAELYKTFADVMGRKWFPEGWQGEKLNEELAITMVIQRLRKILGTEELTAVRTALLARAHSLSPTDG